MYFYGFDPTIVLLIPAMILSIYAQAKVKTTFHKYLSVPSKKGMTGFDAARKILDRNGLSNVPIEMTHGTLSDHYDPRSQVMRLSAEVYSGRSIASVSVAAHESGHAIQHGEGYTFLKMRNRLAPVVGFASQLAFPLIFIGLFVGSFSILFNIGILFYCGAVLFQVITLPVELNASSRAIVLLGELGIVMEEEKPYAKKVLSAAALTYVAAMAVAIVNLVRLLLIKNSRD